MRVFRKMVSLFCVVTVMVSSFTALAADEPALGILIQYASELSDYTDHSFYHQENTERYITYKTEHPDDSWETVITYVNIGLDNPFYSNISSITEPGETNVLVNKYNQLSQSYVPSGLETISYKYASGTQKLRTDARMWFEKMCTAASKLGLTIRATSTYRSYLRQYRIYTSKINWDDPTTIEARDLVSARAGHSEHQLGLAVDVLGTGLWVADTDEYEWYSEHAHEYGFIIRYPEGKASVTGYTFEPWHLRYLGVELATAVFESGLTYDEYYASVIDVSSEGGTSNLSAVGVTTDSNVTAFGQTYELSTLNVRGETYYKLRDIAVILDTTPGQFDLSWDSAAQTIKLTPSISYSSETPIGVHEQGQIISVALSEPKLIIGDNTVELTAYLFAGSNYYELGALASALGLTCSANPVTGDVIISA